jgi:hypothetical protein
MGVVQSADGLPLMHTVHAGNIAKTKTLKAMVSQVLGRLPVERAILVADCGLLSLDNMTERGLPPVSKGRGRSGVDPLRPSRLPRRALRR